MTEFGEALAHITISFSHIHPWSYSMSYCHVKWVGFLFLLRNRPLKHCPLSVAHPFSWRPPRPFWSIRAFSQPALMCGIIATPWILIAPQKAVHESIYSRILSFFFYLFLCTSISNLILLYLSPPIIFPSCNLSVISLVRWRIISPHRYDGILRSENNITIMLCFAITDNNTRGLSAKSF